MVSGRKGLRYRETEIKVGQIELNKEQKTNTTTQTDSDVGECKDVWTSPVHTRGKGENENTERCGLGLCICIAEC
jgi:hypothetical protein